MADVPADAGRGMGAFEDLHGLEGAANFAQTISARASSMYGVAGRAWLEWLTSDAQTLKARVREASARIAERLVPEASGGQVERVGARFAVVAAAGELATEAGITGWTKGEAERGARACFNAWLASRGGIGNGEVAAMIRQVRHFLEANGEGRFTWWHRAADDHSAKTLQRAGFRRLVARDGEPIKTNGQHLAEFGDRMPAASGEEVGVEYFVMTEVFRTEVCKGFDYQAVARVLRDHECLVTEKDRLDIKTRLPGLGHARCYRIVPAIFEVDL
jgi:putative DNA primase/helicase